MKSGSLADRNVLELLMDCHKTHRNASLKLSRKSTEKHIFLKSGSILRAQSNIEKEKLGQILIRKNLISPWDLELALSQLQDSKRRLGAVLLGMSSLKEAVLNSTLVSQARDIIFSLID